jgi:hypothetical protein
MKPARLRLLCPLLLLAACGDAPVQPEPVPLSALAARSVRFVLNDIDVTGDTPLPGGHRFTLFVNDLPDGSCTRLQEGIRAILSTNGTGDAPMRVELGGVATSPGRTVCVEPGVVYDYDPAVWAAAPTEDLEVRLEQEGSAPVRLRVVGGKAKRRFEVVPPAQAGTLTAGEVRRYSYQPASDAGGTASATLNPVGTSLGGQLATTLEPDGRVRVEVPASVPAGRQDLHLTRSAPAQLTACEGVAACEGTLFHTETVSVDIVR